MQPKQKLTLAEGQVGRGPEGTIGYTPVTSCIMVTVTLKNGEQVGGHLALIAPPGAYKSNEVLGEMRRLIGGQPIASVKIDGHLDTWRPEYLDTPAFDDRGESNYINSPNASNKDITLDKKICQQLGFTGQPQTFNRD